MKKTALALLSITLILAAADRSGSQQHERLLTESLGLTHGQYLVADLASLPNGDTALILRDRNGRLGMIIAVSDRAGAERARIEFYDAGGALLGTLNAASSGGPLEGRVQRLEDMVFPLAARPGDRLPQSNTLNVWLKLDSLEQRIRAIEQAR